VDAEPSALDRLAAHAHDSHVVVVGGGIGGLVAALECAKVGIRVTLIEAGTRLGGAVRTVDLGGVRVDLGAEGYATRGGAVRRLVDDLGLTDAVVPTAPRAEWIAGLPGGPVPVPEATLRGIPENPWDESVRRLIGWRGAWRAYLDRIRPPLTIGQERSLGRLVRTRMGDLVLDRIVAPLSVGGFAIDPDDVDVEAVVPGLNAALTRTGSLAGAVMQLRADRARDRRKSAETDADTTRSDAGLESLDGGMSMLVEALEQRLRALDVSIVTGVRVAGLARRDDRWIVELDAGPDSAGTDTDAAADPAADTETDSADTDAAADREVGADLAAAPGRIVSADQVVIATGAADAYRLLRDHVPDLVPTRTTALEVVTLVVRSPALSAAPPATAVYPIAGAAAAASVTDSTARWPWMRTAPDVHALKVTFGRPGGTPTIAELDDDAAAAQALAAAAALRGVALDGSMLLAAHRERYLQPDPASALGHAERTETVRALIHRVDGLAAVGAWLAGTGLAQVVPDAVHEAERVRRTALWGSADEHPADEHPADEHPAG
jgi:oxygen-dependent protoporphyrinogen oxidase